ncbi:MAG: TatD family hydrolase [bacterium]|jgi:TatD DNase family protein
MLIDSHAHLQDPSLLPEIEDILYRAKEAGVVRVICPGYDLKSSRQAVTIADRYPEVGAAVGLHPGNLEDVSPDAFRELADLAQHPKVVAVGEIGLDYVNGVEDKEAQKKVFLRQLELAGELDLPAIVHNRESHADVLAAMTSVGPLGQGGVMHCFSGSAELAGQCTKLGYYISFAGPVTFKNARRLPEVVAQVPLDRLLCETDSPYLSPEPFRGKRNEPARVIHVAAKLAELLEQELEDLAPVLTANTKRLFQRLT